MTVYLDKSQPINDATEANPTPAELARLDQIVAHHRLTSADQPVWACTECGSMGTTIGSPLERDLLCQTFDFTCCHRGSTFTWWTIY